MIIGLLVTAILALFSKIALATPPEGFQQKLYTGIKAATGPLIESIKTHWGKAVFITGCISALIGEGDAKQRVVRAAISAIAAGSVILGLMAIFTE